MTTATNQQAQGDQQLPSKHKPSRSEEEDAYLPTRLVFGWVLPLLSRGMQRTKERDEQMQAAIANPSDANPNTTAAALPMTDNPLQTSDLLSLHSDIESGEAYRQFRAAWIAELQRVGYKLQSTDFNAMPSSPTSSSPSSDEGREQPSLYRALLIANRRDLIVSGVLRLLSLVSLAMPFFLRFFVKWMTEYSDPMNPAPTYMGFVWAVAIPLTALASTIFGNQHALVSLRGHLRMRGACALAIFDKSLLLWPHHGLGGLITQMHSSDTFKFFEMYQYFHWLWIAPLQVIASLVCLYIFIGWAGVISIGVMVIAMPIQSGALQKVAEAQGAVSASADVRQGLLREIVRGIRIIKFMGLESHMSDRMHATRSVEERNFDRVYLWKCVTDVLGTFSPMVVTLVVFIAAWLLGNPVNSDSVFSTMVMLQLLRTPVMALSGALAKLDEVRVSVKRIQDFLLFDERPPNASAPPASGESTTVVDPTAFPLSPQEAAPNPLVPVVKGEDDVMEFTTTVNNNNQGDDSQASPAQSAFETPRGFPLSSGGGPSADTPSLVINSSKITPTSKTSAISLTNVSILKESGDQLVPVMQDVSLEFPRGSLTVIYGPTGSGKSLILKAILREVLLHPNSVVEINADNTDNQKRGSWLGDSANAAGTPPSATTDNRGLIAYASQDAYLRRGTVRDNVLFGAPYNAARFDAVAACSQLVSDLRIMDKGDQTQLTDRGANLSGGQRQRIAVARAAYADSSIVLLDDPLSALDPLVGRKLAHECISEWMGKRTRVLVTNQVDMLLLADQIVITKDLRVAFSGTWKELQDTASEEVRGIFPEDARVTLFGETRGSKKFAAAGVLARMAVGGVAHDSIEPVPIVVDAGAQPNSRKPSLKRFVSSFKFRIATKFTAMARKRSNLDVFRATADMSEKDKAVLENALKALFESKSIVFNESESFTSTSFAAGDVQDVKAKLQRRWKKAHEANKMIKAQQHKVQQNDAATGDAISVVAVGPTTAASNPAAPSSVNDDDRQRQEEDAPPPSPLMWHFANQSWLNFTLMMLFCGAQRVVNIIADLVVSNWASRKEMFGYTLNDAGYAAWYGTAVGIFFACLVAFDVVYYVFGASHAVRRTHSSMFHRLLFAPTSFFDANSLGTIASRFSRDLECVDRAFVERLNALLYNAAMVLGSCVLMCYAAPYLAAVLVAVAALYALVMRYYNGTAVNLRSLEATCRTPMISLIGEALSGLDVVRSYGVTDAFRKEHTDAYESSANALYNVGALQLWFNQQLGMLYALIVVFMTVMVAGLMTSYDSATRSSQMTVLSLAVTYTVSMPVGYLMNLFTELDTFYGSVERATEYATEIEQEAGAPKIPLPWAGAADEPAAATSVADDWPRGGGVEFEDVCLRYRSDLPLALNGLTVQLRAGEHIGVVGRTGSGKSTLIQALFRLVELDAGRVVLDGVETGKVPLGRLRAGMTIVPQDPMVFQGTVRANIDPLCLYTDETCESALRRVGLMDSGFNLSSSVEESGGNMSTGQRQLLCLARAMVRSRPLLVMDEATANVDGATDERMQEIVRTDFAHLTTITIAHRLDTIIESDRILVMDKGRLVEFDTPRKLLADRTSVFFSIASGLGEEQLSNLIMRAH